jgi:hypothetical protein
MISTNKMNAVSDLDLEPIKAKLMHRESGEGWSLEHVNAVEPEYRRFLCLMQLYPNEQIAPLVDVDTFWHYHILDTAKYAADCEQAFGYFLHHYPYLGMGSEQDDAQREDAAERMRTLYEQTFGDNYTAAAAGIQGANAFCAVTAKPAFCAVTAKPAFCAVTAKAAFCAVTAKPAFCAVTAKSAFCPVSAGAANAQAQPPAPKTLVAT